MPKLNTIKLIPVSIPYIDDPPTVFQEAWGRQLYVKVELGDLIGWGEVLVYGSNIIDSYIGVFNDVIIPAVTGEVIENVGDVHRLVNKLEKLLFTAGLCGVVSGAMGGLEMALWDALGKYLNKPISELLGVRIRDKVPVYASFPRYSTVDYVVKAVDKALSNGFNTVKLHQHVNDTVDSIKAIRENMGYGVKVALDLNAAFNKPEEALNFLNKVHRYEPYWVEEPIWPPNNYELLTHVADKSPVPIAAGENEYYIGGFKELARIKLMYIQPDVSKVGGLIRFMDIIKEASTLGKPVAPHHRPHKSILTHLYTLHVASVVSNIAIVEWPLSWIKDIYNVDVEVKDGEVSLSRLMNSGVGVNVNEEALGKYPYVSKYSPLVFH
ncbi:mandelate racemase/muconate lactonizing enzyme family protein [Caldivirga maquilingensis]|uniref:Mandelate racemase/muconate lactonizing protein n=1 Tax=Caldivirga maquilingensis (strain ATCC 700844 / DSM 13496 / JCM 10307 / IC-167) TaxID=397948 RepID=A8MDW0_CALMQ|nr:mandelate racemase/muconate lactonizing enzyme family protein [Caldivirga maquilingensis]ABW01966.1 Mandelate racemase/muconate lactonizing protein [Caldivirga maquilingensis IC-167]